MQIWTLAVLLISANAENANSIESTEQQGVRHNLFAKQGDKFDQGSTISTIEPTQVAAGEAIETSQASEPIVSNQFRRHDGLNDYDECLEDYDELNDFDRLDGFEDLDNFEDYNYGCSNGCGYDDIHDVYDKHHRRPQDKHHRYNEPHRYYLYDDDM